MKAGEEYYLEIRRELAHEIETLSNDISLITNDELRQVARNIRIERMMRILELDSTVLAGAEDERLGRGKDSGN